MIWIHHGRLVNVVRVKFALPHRLHVVAQLTCHRGRPPVVSPIVNLRPRVVVLGLLKVFWLRRRLLALDDAGRELASGGGRRLGPASGVLGAVGGVGRLRLLELVALAPVVLGSFSAFVGVHLCNLIYVKVKDFNNGVMSDCVWTYYLSIKFKFVRF